MRVTLSPEDRYCPLYTAMVAICQLDAMYRMMLFRTASLLHHTGVALCDWVATMIRCGLQRAVLVARCCTAAGEF